MQTRDDLLEEFELFTSSIGCLARQSGDPPGRARLATIPAPIGSPAVANTMGIVDVARFAASVGGVLCVRMRVTLRWTNSAAISLNRSVCPSPQR
jgi:hypothetical protein